MQEVSGELGSPASAPFTDQGGIPRGVMSGRDAAGERKFPKNTNLEFPSVARRKRESEVEMREEEK